MTKYSKVTVKTPVVELVETPIVELVETKGFRFKIADKITITKKKNYR